jgi:uncharacterized protein (DUF885 family)
MTVTVPALALRGGPHRFDVRAYHEEVLGPGALPFPVLDGHLERWAAQVSSGA